MKLLHLSDAHFGLSHRDGMRDVIQAALEDVVATLAYDFVVFSGDVANIGSEAEYHHATAFLASIAAKKPILVVPGNHDVFRPLAQTSKLREASLSRDAYLDARTAIQAGERFRAFQEFSKAYDFDWRSSILTARRSFPEITFIGLNTALLSCDDADEQHLVVDQEQLNQALVEAHRARTLVVAVGHHPLSWLSPWNSADIAQAIRRRRVGAHAYLCGHLHLPEGSSISTSTGEQLVTVQAGAAYQDARWEQSFWHLELQPERSRLLPKLFLFNRKSGMFLPDSARSQPIVCDLATDRAQVSLTIHSAVSASHGQIVLPRSPRAFAEALDEAFHLVWEPGWGSAEPGWIYWPVRLRKPTLIHAAQAFVAAAFQQRGVRIILCLDDLGNVESDAEPTFIGRMAKHFGLVGGTWGEVEVCRASRVLTDDKLQAMWLILSRWLTRESQLEHVLAVSKLLGTDDADPVSALRKALERKPRKLMAPVVVWSCLEAKRVDMSGKGGWFTIGGYDERMLWAAWREAFGAGDGLGHVYVPELKRLTSRGTGTLVMGEDSMYWASRDDILTSLKADENPPSNRSHVTGWLIEQCLLLPKILRRESLMLGGREIGTPSGIVVVDEVPRESLLEDVATKARDLLLT
ncbi:MAG: metallophosphoesterase [Candidatus Rokubacteria bacterium]|nr:metallophosphoesterase [Candidatus Rokubacteria bacterium]